MAVDLRPSLSVVVPVYNAAMDLRSCLESIARSVATLSAAEREGVEVIVCDNWSKDGSGAIAKDFRMPVRYRVVQPAQHEPNRTRNWRVGLENARAEWMLMLHADDLMAPTGLAALLLAIRRPEATRASLIAGRHRTFEDPASPGGIRPRWGAASLIKGTLLARVVLALHCPFMPFVLMRRSAYEQIGGLDESWELVQDWELWMRMSAVGDVLLIPDEIGWWRVHPTSPKYREINAREHVALSRALPERIRAMRARPLARARKVALARAAFQLDGLEADSTSWLGNDKLPSIPVARGIIDEMYRTVAARLFALRALGVIRRISPVGRNGGLGHR